MKTYFLLVIVVSFGDLTTSQKYGEGCVAPNIWSNGNCVSPPDGLCKHDSDCVPNADCYRNECKCISTAVATSIREYTFCITTSNYGKSCSEHNYYGQYNTCDKTLDCNDGICKCPGTPGRSNYNAFALNFGANLRGIYSSTLGACVCNLNFVYNPISEKCTCDGAAHFNYTAKTCTPYANSSIDEFQYVCGKDVPVIVQDKSCGCTMINSTYNATKDACICPPITTANLTSNTCDPYANAILQGSVYTCPAYSTANDNASSCDCMQYSSYNAGSQDCECQGATYLVSEEVIAKGTSDGQKDIFFSYWCNRYQYALLDVNGIYACPKTTFNNYGAQRCDCIITNAQQVDPSGICECPVMSYLGSNSTTCEPYTFGSYSSVNGFYCLGEMAPILDLLECGMPCAGTDSSSCDCADASHTYVSNDGAYCIGYTNATFDVNLSTFICPDGSSMMDTVNFICL